MPIKAGIPLRLENLRVTAPAGLDLLKVIATEAPLTITVSAAPENALSGETVAASLFDALRALRPALADTALLPATGWGVQELALKITE